MKLFKLYIQIFVCLLYFYFIIGGYYKLILKKPFKKVTSGKIEDNQIWQFHDKIKDLRRQLFSYNILLAFK